MKIILTFTKLNWALEISWHVFTPCSYLADSNKTLLLCTQTKDTKKCCELLILKRNINECLKVYCLTIINKKVFKKM